MERLTHIKRIFGKRKASTPGGEPVDAPDIYVDMQRIDRMSVMEHPGAQEVIRSTKWKDKPDDPPGGNPTREMMTIRLIDPEDPNPDDPSAWIDLPVIRRMTTMRHPGAQETITSFHPSSAAVEPDSTARRVSVKRVTFAETNADATLDDTSYYADGSAYQRKADTVDTSQYLDVEVIESYPSTRHPGAQGVTVTMNNNLIKEMFADTPAGAPRGPARLDPLQNLLNVSWGGGAVEFERDGALLHTTSSAADIKTMTIVMWFNIADENPDYLGAYSLLQFGFKNGEYPGVVTGPSGIYYFRYGSSGIPDKTISWNFFGTYVEPTSVGDPVPRGTYIVGNQLEGPATDVLGGHALTGIETDRWHCLILSADLTIDSTVRCDLVDPDHETYDTIGLTAPKFTAVFDGNDHSPLNPAEGLAYYFNVGTFNNCSISGTGSGGGGIATPIEAQDIALQGMEFGLPGLASTITDGHSYPDPGGGETDAPALPKVRYGPVMIWFDQLIDPTNPSNYAKFVKVDPVSGESTPQSPSLAINAFGKPDYLFTGGPNEFIKNGGKRELDVFTKGGGTIRKFTERPKFTSSE